MIKGGNKGSGLIFVCFVFSCCLCLLQQLLRPQHQTCYIIVVMADAAETVSHNNSNNKKSNSVASSAADAKSVSSLSGGELNNNKKDDSSSSDDGTTTTTTTDPSKAITNTRIRFYFIRHGESGANKWGIVAGHDDVPLTDGGITEAKLLGQSSWIHIHKRRRQRNQRNNGSKEASVVAAAEGSEEDGFWRVYSSDLSRARDTATYALIEGQQHHHIKQLIQDHRLRERSYGIRQGFSRSIPEEEIIAIWKQYGKEPPPYETDQQLWERGRDWMIDIIKDVIDVQRLEDNVQIMSNDDETNNNSNNENNTTKVYHILVAAHAGFIREILLNLIPLSTLVEHGAKFDAKRNNKLIIPNTSISILEIDPSNNKQPLQKEDVKVIDLLNADHLQKINVYDD